MNITSLKVGQKSKIIKVTGKGNLRHRLLEMGITPGTSIEIIKKAPLGDPLEITIRGYELTLRKDDAELIDVELINR